MAESSDLVCGLLLDQIGSKRDSIKRAGHCGIRKFKLTLSEGEK